MTIGAGAGGDGSPPLVALDHITKRFPGVLANDEVDLELRAGEVHALIGENGAGKSTLMRVLYGMYPADGGRILVRGQEIKIGSPRDAIANGIGMVHQHFVLVDPFTVTENIILGEEGGERLDIVAAQQRIAELADSYGFRVDPGAVVEELSVGEEQRVEILKALYRGVEILILDEPTAVLTPSETKDLFDNLRKLREAGRTIVFISHKLDEVMEIADRITVLRRGRVVGETRPAETSKAKLAEMMVGRPVLFRLEKPTVQIGEPVLRVQDLTGDGKLNGVSLEVRAGEILGVAGVEGNGQRELAESLIGLRTPASGTIELEGAAIAGRRGVRHPQRRGRVHPRGPARAGSGPQHVAVGERACSGARTTPSSPGALGVLFIKKIKELAARLVETFDIRTRSVDVAASTLSGGNQQKLILARELETDPKLLIAAQPTRGIGRRGDRVRLEADPRPEGRRQGRAAHLGRARRDLRALGPDRDLVRGQDHRRVPARCPARADRDRHARPGARGGGVVSAEGLAPPIGAARTRPAWLESFAGQFLALLASFGIALLAGSLLIIAYGENPIDVYGSIFDASLGSADGIGYVLAIATPLIFAALAVSVCFKGGLFNIGVEGQYLVAMITATVAELNLDFLPGPLLIPAVLLAAMIGGMIWAAVPGILKVRTGAHEVVTTIMMNGIAISLVGWALNGPLH